MQDSEEENSAYEQRVKQLETQLAHDDKLSVARLERDLESAHEATLRLHVQVDMLQVRCDAMRCGRMPVVAQLL